MDRYRSQYRNVHRRNPYIRLYHRGERALPRSPLPSHAGLEAWIEAKKALHSVYYRNPSIFRDAKTIVVVGGGPSGQDLVSDLLAAGKNVVHSVTGAAREDLHDGRLKVRGRIARYGSLETGHLAFEDGSEESAVDRAALATGYKFDFPFFPAEVLRTSVPPPVPPLPGALYNSTYHAFPLGKHIFPLVSADEFPSSTVAFLGLPIRVAPLPLLEAQMRAVLHVFEHPESLDPTQEAIDIVSRYEALRARIVRGRASASSPSKPKPPLGGEEIDLGDLDLDTAPGLTAADGRVELAIASAWHRFDGHEQFAYRDALHGLSGAGHRVAGWEVEMYDAKGVLREEWRDLERLGEAGEWVKGVGAGEGEEGTKEWVELMRRLLRRAEERHHELSRL
ncbi:hypothetical protein GSI_14822 [Ganoderma sinense ZZ0214-1]|uniref:FAD/NAD(P)-binding domain-containing protein n=1 Tax=Ganoderma sinense ZZ0214-1 TaxID=1077348 RepID=A0A2G8RPS5_9APHY|nr:hypothetical protein GSI_14822 [Ganoderma sinense ZZ0214-1]